MIRLKKIILPVIFYLLLIILEPCVAVAVPATENPWDEPTQILELDEIEGFVHRMDDELKSVLPEVDFRALIKDLASGETSLKPQELFQQCINYIFREVMANSILLGQLVVLAVICAVLQNLTAAFEKNTTGQLAHMVAYLVLITLAVASFGLAIGLGREVVDKLVTIMQALMPLLLTLLVAVGGITSAAIFHPVIFVTITVFATVIKNIVLPLIFFAAVLDIVSGLSEQFQVSRLAGLLRGVSLGVMGLFSTIFLGVMAIQGVAGAVGDSVAFRAAKFATGAFIPVVGGIFSDALETVIRSSLLIKNAVGIAGVFMIILILVVPLVKIMAMALIYKFAGAMVQPMGESKISDCLNGLGNSLMTVFGAVAVVGLLFFLALAIVVGLGNVTVMLH